MDFTLVEPSKLKPSFNYTRFSDVRPLEGHSDFGYPQAALSCWLISFLIYSNITATLRWVNQWVICIVNSRGAAEMSPMNNVDFDACNGEGIRFTLRVKLCWRNQSQRTYKDFQWMDGWMTGQGTQTHIVDGWVTSELKEEGEIDGMDDSEKLKLIVRLQD